MKYLPLCITILITFCYINLTKQQQEKNNSALVFYLSEYGLKTVEKSLIPVIFNNKPIPLPLPGAFEQKIDFIGTLKLNITELTLKFDNISEQQMNIEFIENNNTINLTIKEISGNLNFTYDFQSGFYSNKATGNVLIRNMSVEISTELGTVANAQNPEKLGPNLQIKYLKVPQSPVLSISFDAPGRTEMLVKFFFDLVSNSISQQIVENLTTEKVQSFNKNISDFMANLELQNTYGNITVDYSLNSAPLIKNKTLEIAFDALMSADTPTNYTFNGTKYAVPHAFYGEAPIYGFFNQYLLDGFFEIMQRQSKLKGFVPAELVQTPLFNLDVQGISKFIPQISEKYNATDKVDLSIASVATPLIGFKDQKLKGAFNFTVDFAVRNSQNLNKSESAANVNFKLNADLGFSVKNAKLEIKVKSVEFTDVQVISSNIGPINTEKLKSNLNMNINIILLIYSTFEYDLAIFLPRIAGISLNQTTVVPHEGYLEYGIVPQPEAKPKQLAFLVEEAEMALEALKALKQNKTEKQASLLQFAKETFDGFMQEMQGNSAAAGSFVKKDKDGQGKAKFLN